MTPKKTASADWTPKTIHKHLEDAGWTMEGLAKHHGIAYTTLTSAMYSPGYHRSQERIASAIGVDPKMIWPSRYDTSGKPIPRSRLAKKRSFNTVNKRRTKRKHHKLEAIKHEHPK